MKVLFATDGSPCSNYAEQVMSQFPFAETPHVQLVNVCPTDDLHAIGPDVPLAINEMIDQCRGQAGELLDQVEKRVSSWAAGVERTLLAGHVAHELLEEIDRSKPDVVVVGSHGYGAFRRFLLGSVSTRLVEHAHCSVLIARPHRGETDRTATERIVIADDGSQMSTQAWSRIRSAPLSDKHSVRVISVMGEVPVYGMEAYLETQEAWQTEVANAKQRVHDIAEQFKECTPSVQSEVLTGASIPTEIVADADEYNADLIVIGGTGRTGLSRFLLGSVSRGVLNQAHCSVWIERGGN